MACSERLPTRLNPLAERTCFSQVRECDYAGARYGGRGGDVTARAAWVGDGCEAEAYAEMAAGEIALMSNGGPRCDNYEKAMLAESLGAAGIDGGLLSFPFPFLVCMENTYR